MRQVFEYRGDIMLKGEDGYIPTTISIIPADGETNPSQNEWFNGNFTVSPALKTPGNARLSVAQ